MSVPSKEELEPQLLEEEEEEEEEEKQVALLLPENRADWLSSRGSETHISILLFNCSLNIIPRLQLFKFQYINTGKRHLDF